MATPTLDQIQRMNEILNYRYHFKLFSVPHHFMNRFGNHLSEAILAASNSLNFSTSLKETINLNGVDPNVFKNKIDQISESFPNRAAFFNLSREMVAEWLEIPVSQLKLHSILESNIENMATLKRNYYSCFLEDILEIECFGIPEYELDDLIQTYILSVYDFVFLDYVNGTTINYMSMDSFLLSELQLHLRKEKRSFLNLGNVSLRNFSKSKNMQSVFLKNEILYHVFNEDHGMNKNEFMLYFSSRVQSDIIQHLELIRDGMIEFRPFFIYHCKGSRSEFDENFNLLLTNNAYGWALLSATDLFDQLNLKKSLYDQFLFQFERFFLESADKILMTNRLYDSFDGRPFLIGNFNSRDFLDLDRFIQEIVSNSLIEDKKSVSKNVNVLDVVFKLLRKQQFLITPQIQRKIAKQKV